jgi:hypothetical protein
LFNYRKVLHQYKINDVVFGSTIFAGGNVAGSGGGGGSTASQPKTYIVGTTAGAPANGSNTWTLAAFANKWVTLFIGNVQINFINDGVNPYITKATAASTTITLNGAVFNTGDVLTYILT